MPEPARQPLRIVHLGKYYPPAFGGIETHTRTLAQALAARGHDVTVVALNHAAADGSDATFDRFRRTPHARDDDGPVRVLRVGRWASVAKFDVAPGLTQLLRRMANDPPDVWHLHAPNVTAMLAVLAVPRLGPLVITHHSDIVRQRVLKQLVRPFEARLYGRAALILATSPAYPAGSPLLGTVRAKVETLALGLDLDPFARPSSAALTCANWFRHNDPGPLWVTVGRLVSYKALGVALRALRHVPGTLLVFGTGPMEAAWRALAATLGVADRVVWRGRVSGDELVGGYHAATAHWFPSNARSEGFGLVQVEAMASGCPTINAAVPDSGVGWVCRDGVAGLTVPVNDPAALAAAAHRLMAEPGLRDRLSAGGRREAGERFTAAVMAERCEAFYRRVVR